MIVLAFDSAARCASVAVSENGQLLAQYNIDNGLTQSELLLPMAESILHNLRLTVDDVDIFAASVGPGSFTGVRIGASLVKGLAFGKNKPCAAVSTLEALAENMRGLEGILSPSMDARRGQVYNALFRAKDGKIERLTGDRAISVSELGEELKKFEGERIYVNGDGYLPVMRALGDTIKLESTPALLINENAYSIALVAERLYSEGKCVSDLELAPTYLRMPQAERERLERLKAGGGI